MAAAVPYKDKSSSLQVFVLKTGIYCMLFGVFIYTTFDSVQRYLQFKVKDFIS